ncbi:hypothetical protein [Immundisolibacter sp.]|uniref:hypothetical protein n=1 Tax=Immundisolibacter sp. TaxID=1934948 RepID=UPI003F50070A
MSICYTNRPLDTINSVYKTEVIHRQFWKSRGGRNDYTGMCGLVQPSSPLAPKGHRPSEELEAIDY